MIRLLALELALTTSLLPLQGRSTGIGHRNVSLVDQRSLRLLRREKYGIEGLPFDGEQTGDDAKAAGEDGKHIRPA